MKYTCEYCGYPYDTEEECKKCEQFHIEPLGIQAGAFKPMAQTSNRYLDRVVLRMSDETLVQYTYDQVVDPNIQIDPHPSEADRNGVHEQ